ncbi:Transcriptional regulator, TetR family [Mycetocola reblochoni REB411]|uniref:Transcriptional regulator, TetR family n=2 Tax=Mycetocola reblochoni TaxID=331618 RepID=A0A1R4KAE4_9MICO|nr:Transcriptional regulator, TetR family [Mycetocola reblochoni REB411]
MRSALEATERILDEVGYDALTMTAVAARAGVGKQTLYRWWPSKHALVAECVLAGALPVAAILPVSTGHAADDLRQWWRSTRAALDDDRHRAVFRALSTAALSEPDAAERLDRQLGGPIEQALAAVLADGAASGELRAELDIAATVRLLMGALVLALVTGRDGALDDAVLDTVLDGARVR